MVLRRGKRRVAFKRKRSYTAIHRRRRRLRAPRRTLGPLTLIRKLKYVELILLNPAAGGTAYNRMSCNGLYDPDISGTGHQPMGFDQYMTLYGAATVLSSKITARFMTVGTGAGDQIIAGIYTDNDTTPPASGNFEQLLEQSTTKWKFIGSETQAKNGNCVSMHFNASRWFHKSPRAMMSDVQFSSTTSANPTTQAYFNIFAFPSDAVSDAGSLDCWVTMEFVVAFTQLNTLGSS